MQKRNKSQIRFSDVLNHEDRPWPRAVSVCVTGFQILEHVNTLQFPSVSDLHLLPCEVNPDDVSNADICTKYLQSSLLKVQVPF